MWHRFSLYLFKILYCAGWYLSRATFEWRWFFWYNATSINPRLQWWWWVCKKNSALLSTLKKWSGVHWHRPYFLPPRPKSRGGSEKNWNQWWWFSVPTTPPPTPTKSLVAKGTSINHVDTWGGGRAGVSLNCKTTKGGQKIPKHRTTWFMHDP